jgi:hypothetical protein
MRKRSNIWLILGLGLMMTVFVNTLSVHAQSEVLSIRSTQDYIQAEELIEAIANELYKAHQEYPGFAYNIEYKNNELVAVTVSGIDNHTIANRIANQIIVLEDAGRAVANMDMSLLPALPEMSSTDMLNEQQAEAYEPNVDVNNGFVDVLFTSASLK